MSFKLTQITLFIFLPEFYKSKNINLCKRLVTVLIIHFQNFKKEIDILYKLAEVITFQKGYLFIKYAVLENFRINNLTQMSQGHTL